MSKAIPSKRQLQPDSPKPNVRRRELHARAKDTHTKSAKARKAVGASPSQARSSGQTPIDSPTRQRSKRESIFAAVEAVAVASQVTSQERTPALITLQIEEGQTWRWQVYDQHGSVMGQQTKCVDYVTAVEYMLRWITSVGDAPWD